MEVIQTFEEVSNRKLNYRFEGRRSGDVEAIYADKKTNILLGWIAETSLADSIKNAWKWEQKKFGVEIL